MNNRSSHFRIIKKESQKLLKPVVCALIAGNCLYTFTSLSKGVEARPLINEEQKTIRKKSFVAEAIARSGPAVVTIETQRRVFSRRSDGLPPGLLIDPYFERFFGFPGTQAPRSRIENGQGSGVIFAAQGLVLTNAHVVEKSEKLIVGLSDGRRVKGEVVGEDSLTDLAVIRLNGSGPWPIATLGDSEKINVGDWAIAVGNPFGLENTVTLGIISNLNRNVSQLGISDKRIDLIQTDAAINPGNSGGPLLNAIGEVIGINTLVRSGPGAGLGFAIPINKARIIAKQLVEKGRAIHPIIGVSLSSLPLQSKPDHMFTKAGAIVRYLIPGGPAEKGGLRLNDLIISVGNKSIKNPSDVVNAISSHGIDSPLNFIIIRGHNKIRLLIQPIDMNSL
tara:strand:+ start:29052 stop:30227 length:1176 start_codon:yes stop_codon:yes gene_type:complete